jgi:hypothetical protein
MLVPCLPGVDAAMRYGHEAANEQGHLLLLESDRSIVYPTGVGEYHAAKRQLQSPRVCA